MTESLEFSISVVVPVYNSEATLERAIHSVARQSLLPDEVILVDDCSTDGSRETCEKLKSSLSHLFPIRILPLDHNRGPSFARNRGWDLAKGSYIAFLDADDSWLPEKLTLQYDFMKNHPHIALSGHLCGIHRAIDSRQPGLKTTFLHPYRMLLSNPFSTPTVMLRRGLPYRFSETLRFSEDYHLWLRVALDGLAVARMESELTLLHKERYGAGGLSGAMWEMERGELRSYQSLFQEKRIPLLLLCGLIPFSLLKFVRRLIHLKLRKAH